jgi:hypothetical protein
VDQQCVHGWRRRDRESSEGLFERDSGWWCGDSDADGNHDWYGDGYGYCRHADTDGGREWDTHSCCERHTDSGSDEYPSGCDQHANTAIYSNNAAHSNQHTGTCHQHARTPDRGAHQQTCAADQHTGATTHSGAHESASADICTGRAVTAVA